MKQRYRYTIYFQQHCNSGLAQFDGEAYYYDHSEGSWHFADEGARELVAQGSDVSYFTVEPLTKPYVAEASE